MSNENIAPSTDSTKVYYYVDEETTPYMTVLVVPPEEATLAHFKRAIPRKALQYFTKILDPDLGKEVKVEVTDEKSVLQASEKGFIQLFLTTTASSASGTLPRKAAGGGGTLPRRHPTLPSSQLLDQRKRRPHGEDDGGTGSGGGTVVSGRAGEHLAELYTSNSEDPYRYDASRLSMTSSSMYDRLGPGEHISRRRKPRKSRYRKAYVPSTIGSAPESSGTSMSLPRIVEVRLTLHAADFLGISVVSVEGSILVSDVFPAGAVAREGTIDVGDQIVQVNQHSFENLSDSEAIRILRRVAAAKKPLKLYVAKRSVRAEAADPLTALTTDQTLPLDISVWVENAVHCTERQRFGLDEPSEAFDGGTTLDSSDEEEERILYAERRNGVPLRLMEDAQRQKENDANQLVYSERLHSKLDPLLLLRVMTRADSGLVVKNRKWLKIAVPNSFIGRELVDWLSQHIEDLTERKAARAYASSLLEAGYIRHVVSKLTFTEKCYYVFERAFLPPLNDVMGAESTQTSGGTGRAEGATEVTYIASPAVAPRLSQDSTWPFSPITVYQRDGIGPRRADCESDYASMLAGTTDGSVAPPRQPPPNTPLSLSLPPPSETAYEQSDDRRRILRP